MSTQTDAFNGKSVAAFLALTFGLTWAVELLLIADGVRFSQDSPLEGQPFWLLAVMFIPGLSAVAVTLFLEKMSFRQMRDTLRIRLGTSLAPYTLFMLLVPALYAAMYGLSWAFGLTELATTMPDPTTDRATVLQVMLPLSIFIGPLVNLIFGFGEELGWRGFLLPRLLPMGKLPAYSILGVIWGLWHAPLIYAGFNYPGYPVAGIAMMCILCFAFGLVLNELTVHYDSSILAGFVHGAANTQGYGVWLWLFPSAHPLLAGSVGLTGIGVWLAAGLITMGLVRRFKP